MGQYYSADGVSIFHGDCLEVMRKAKACGVTAIVTDPPYGLKFMGKEWDHGVPGIPFWKEALRVVKPGGMLLAFGGTRTHHRLMCAIEDAGWEIRDCLSWLYGSGFPKSLDVSKAIDKAAGAKREETGRVLSVTGNRAKGSNAMVQSGLGAVNVGPQEHRETLPATEAAKLWDGWGTALKPAHEPIILAMKPLDGTFAANALKHGVAGINVDGGRVGTEERVNAAAGSIGANGIMGNAGKDEWRDSGKCKELKDRKVTGRWPANLILDEEAGALLDEQSGKLKSGALTAEQQINGGFKGALNCYGTAERGGSTEYAANSGGASRFFYCAKSSKKDRGEGNTHPTCKPTALMRYLVRLVTMPGETIILDPFMGSGSTLVAAKLEGVTRVIGIEQDESYCEIAARRLRGE